jgi:sulfonate transport system substrate-binding protein
MVGYGGAAPPKGCRSFFNRFNNFMKKWLSYYLALLITGILHTYPARGENNSTLRIGYQKASILQKGLPELEKKLLDRGITVEWKEFTSGPPLLAALAGGSIDVGEVGDAPGIFAQAADAPIRYVAYLNSSPHSVGILLPNNSSIKSVSDLKGKKVGFVQGSSAHLFFAKLLQKNGLSLSDITPVYLQPPDARISFNSGNLDAWAIWDPFLSSTEITSHARLLADGVDILPAYGFYFASQKFIEGNGQWILPILFEEANAIGAKRLKDHEKTALLYSEQLGLPIDVARLYEKNKTRYGAYPLTAEVIASQQDAAGLFLAQDLIKKPIKISDYIASVAFVNPSAPGKTQ